MKKKLIAPFAFMMVCLLSVGTVFAASQYVMDQRTFQSGTVNSGWAILEGYRDTSTDRLSNVDSRKLQYGTTTVSLGTIAQPSQFTAQMTVNFKTNGVIKQTSYLRL